MKKLQNTIKGYQLKLDNISKEIEPIAEHGKRNSLKIKRLEKNCTEIERDHVKKNIFRTCKNRVD